MSEDSDKESTRIITRPGPKIMPFKVDPVVQAREAIAAARREPRLDVTPLSKPEPKPVAAAAPIAPVVPPSPVAARSAVRSPLIAPPVKALPAVAALTPAPASGLAAAVAPPAVAAPAAAPVVAAAPASPPAVPPVVASAPPPPAPPPPAPPPPAPAAAVAIRAPVMTVAAFEPVVGWLVVVKGPGRGASLPLRGGRNALGSAPDQDLCLAFGDPAIAAAGHAFVIYDEETREFFVEDGKKKELVRVDGRLLSETRPIRHGDTIRIGSTTLRFVAFCGADFDWRDDAAAGAAGGEPAAAIAGTGDGI